MNPLDQVTERLGLSPIDRAWMEAMVQRAEAQATAAGFPLDDQARLGLGAHLASLNRRLQSGEKVTGVDPALFNEVPLRFRQMATDLLQPLYDQFRQPLDPTEIGLVALHFGAAHERTQLSQ